jgi:perosamine synthetase
MSSSFLYRQPPTAVPIQFRDIICGLIANRKRQDSLCRFQSILIEQTGGNSCYLLSSGRAALTLILLALKIHSERKKVILPAYTCPTVYQSILQAGLIPVLCDVSPTTMDLDRRDLSRLLDKNILAIIPTYLYGLPHDISDLVNIGQLNSIFIVEDAAQAFGAKIGDKMVGNLGIAGFYSFGLGKPLPTGRGGAIICKNGLSSTISTVVNDILPRGNVYDFLSLLRISGYGLAIRPRSWWIITQTPLNPAWSNVNIDQSPIHLDVYTATQAGIAISILERYDQINQIRRNNATRIMQAVSGRDYIITPDTPSNSLPIYLRFPVILDNPERRERLFLLLWEK